MSKNKPTRDGSTVARKDRNFCSIASTMFIILFVCFQTQKVRCFQTKKADFYPVKKKKKKTLITNAFSISPIHVNISIKAL